MHLHPGHLAVVPVGGIRILHSVKSFAADQHRWTHTIFLIAPYTWWDSNVPRLIVFVLKDTMTSVHWSLPANQFSRIVVIQLEAQARRCVAVKIRPHQI